MVIIEFINLILKTNLDREVTSMMDIDAAFKLPAQLISSCAKAFVKCFPKLPKLLAQIIKPKEKVNLSSGQ